MPPEPSAFTAQMSHPSLNSTVPPSRLQPTGDRGGLTTLWSSSVSMNDVPVTFSVMFVPLPAVMSYVKKWPSS